ncbi:MAG: glycosyltransferase family 4 protein [Geminicoccaceae bacterium]
MPLRITHLSHNDQKGGGPLASYRLHHALKDLGAESRMLVLEKHQDDPSVEQVDAGLWTTPIRYADRLPRRLYRKRMVDRIWSPGCFGIGGLEAHAAIKTSDILSFYWINGGFLSVSGIDRLLRLGKPVIWRLSDFWPLTGGCHHPGDCAAYKTACNRCPQLGSDRAHDLAAQQWQRKQRWPKDDLTIVAPSRWLADLAANSALFRDVRIEHIRTGIDLHVFKPCAREKTRRALGLPLDRQLLLFGANEATRNPRKGFFELVEALRILADRGRLDGVDLVLFGSDHTPDIPLDIRMHDRGVITNEIEKASLFGASDLFVTPSLEENLPNTVIEAMASGTPAVAFDVGGTRELIQHRNNGYLARAKDVQDLAAGIATILDVARTDPAIGERSRDAMVAAHDQQMVAKRYLSLYEELHGLTIAA